MRAGLLFALIAVVVVSARLCHSSVLWADDNLPLAAAMQVAHGKVLYRDVWFDKPPLVAWIDLLWGARAGLLLRLAGAAYVMAVSVMAWQFARSKWSGLEGLLAAGFSAFFLTFGLPSAVIPLASDMLLVLPHFAAMYFAWRGRPFWSGVAAGIGLLSSSKAIFVLAACALWQWRSLPLLVAGFAAPNLIALGWMWVHGSLAEYYRQVWQWGSIYAANTFVKNPLSEAVKRTAGWLGFQGALSVGTILSFLKWGRSPGLRGAPGPGVSDDARADEGVGRSPGGLSHTDWKLLAWLALSFAGVLLGLRFFPRYYFLLLPPMTIAAARGWGLLTTTRRSVASLAVVLLLAIPFLRFAPNYLTLARGGTWRDLDIDRDSQAAALKLRALARPGDTLFVWGFRPDIFVYSGLPAGTQFLESQPISGVLADRHLFSNVAIAPQFTDPNRRELSASRPTWVVDGLGPYNPSLALANQPYLADWFANYAEAARTGFSILYRLR
jgi:hypothetical protein